MTVLWGRLYQYQYGTEFQPANEPDCLMDPQQEIKPKEKFLGNWIPVKYKTGMSQFLDAKNLRMVFVGTTVYTLYNLVFCLAMACVVNAPHRTHTMLGPIAKLCIMGVVACVPFLTLGLGSDNPALYPTVDLFLAPFLAEMGSSIDSTMYEQSQRIGAEALPAHLLTDTAFLTTFAFLAGVGLVLSAGGMYFASQVKLANIGEYLPYAVLCGFSSIIGVSLWVFAIKLDTGSPLSGILYSKDWGVIFTSAIHHVPSACIGLIMFFFGPKNPLLVPFLSLAIIILSHVFMFAGGISLQEARAGHWFWTTEELTYSVHDDSTVERSFFWQPTYPFGVVFGALFSKDVNYEAVVNGMDIVFAMVPVYVLRGYLHATALRKCTKTVVDSLAQSSSTTNSGSSQPVLPMGMSYTRLNSGSPEVGVSEEISLLHHDPSSPNLGDQPRTVNIPTVLQITQWYCLNLVFTALVGTGAAVLPNIAVGQSIPGIGVEGLAPRWCSIIVLLYFYATDMSIVAFVPKITFSSLLVLCSIEMLSTWLVKSFSKMRQKEEWLVVPLIVILYYCFGMLKAIGLGVAMSTFIFVGSFYRTGVIKYIANGQTVRSTVERASKDASWLDVNGDLIQIMVLQSYLFFGNASSCLNYIQTMFEQDRGGQESSSSELLPIPKYLIIDFSLVTGMDASVVDIFSEILSLCKVNSCKIFLTGLKPNIKAVLECGGFSPQKADKTLRFISNLEAALGKAEDALLNDTNAGGYAARNRITSMKHLDGGSGFRYSLEQIDEQHDLNFSPHLLALERYTTLVEIPAGNSVYERNGGIIHDNERGLFFIETGLLRVERDPSCSIGSCSGSSFRQKEKHRFATKHPGGAHGAKMRPFLSGVSSINMRRFQTFRLARVGPGFVVGGIELSTGLRNPGHHIAITDCRLHHLPYDKLAEIEANDPKLTLNLYKLLAHLIAYREQKAVDQLTTMHSIMDSDPIEKPSNRKTLGAIQRAMAELGS